MAAINTYCTLAEYKLYADITSTNTNDDSVIEQLLESSSRYIDRKTGKTFYPRYETRYYTALEVPTLQLDDDLLEVSSITNGDDNAISSDDYRLLNLNEYPKWAVQLKEGSDEYWEMDSSGNRIGVIDVAGYWGYHNRYGQEGWSTGGTLGAAITTTTATTFTATAGHSFAVGQIAKCDSEIWNITGVSTNTITIVRGDNGSTAATHLINTTVYIWNVMDDIKQACYEITKAAYGRRSGQNMQGVAQVTAAGVVITPQDVPAQARDILAGFERLY